MVLPSEVFNTKNQITKWGKKQLSTSVVYIIYGTSNERKHPLLFTINYVEFAAYYLFSILLFYVYLCVKTLHHIEHEP